MILEKSGKICQGLYSIGYHFIPSFLLLSDPPVIFDAGMTIAGPKYLQDLTHHLGDAHRLGYIFLTHSHFDHCGAVPYMKRNIEGVKIAASSLAKENLKKPNAIKLIQRLSENIEHRFEERIPDNISFDSFEIDITLEDGDELTLGDGWVVRVIATPGHTRDAVSFYIPRLKALIPGEATGVYDARNDVQPEFLSSYDEYIASLEKLSRLDIELILLPHIHILTGEDAKAHIQKSIKSTEALRQRIEIYLARHNNDRDAVVQAIFKKDFEEQQLVLQDDQSYLVNLTAKVRAVAEKR